MSNLKQNERTAFTMKTVENWAEAYTKNLPQSPTHEEMGTCERPVSMGLSANRLGIGLRLKMENGEHKDFFLNAALMQQILQYAAEGGKQLGWLSEIGTVTFPVLEKERQYSHEPYFPDYSADGEAEIPDPSERN